MIARIEKGMCAPSADLVGISAETDSQIIIIGLNQSIFSECHAL
jgi:hypothetical protein